MTANIIVAIASNGAIGRNNDLLWHLSADLKFFKATTTGHPVIMGRRTFESIGRALPGRRNIVISRTQPQLPQGVELAHSLAEALEMCRQTDPENLPFIIGGGQIYAQAMDYASTIYVTRVFCSPEDADTFFPEIDPDIWKLEDEGEVLHDEASGLDYSFLKYTRR